MSWDLSPTCLGDWVPWADMSIHLSPPCFLLWLPCTLVSPLSPTLSALGDNEFTLVNSCGPCLPEWETLGRHEFTLMSAQGTQSCLPVCVTSVGRMSLGDTCKLMRHLSPRVGDKGETRGSLSLWETWAA